MLGDGTLFARRDEVEAAWSLVEPLLDAQATAQYTPSYAAGTWGPDAADELLARDGRQWRRP
jgi:glucose-6-phosphate 1-dehydrogenase